MGFDLKNFQDASLDAEFLAWTLDNQGPENETHYNRLWNYFRNPLLPSGSVSAAAMNENSRPYFLAQEVGLPARITGILRSAAGQHLTDLRRKEVVVENDIAWRVNSMVDFLFGKPVNIRSKAQNPATAGAIEELLSAMFSANGGEAFFQELALYGAVYGFVDIALRIPADWPAKSPWPSHDFISKNAGAPGEDGKTPSNRKDSDSPGRPGTSSNTTSACDEADAAARSKQILSCALQWVRRIRLETIEAARVLPILAEDDYRNVRYWVQRYYKSLPELDSAGGWLKRLGGRNSTGRKPRQVEVVEIIGSDWWQRYENRQLVAQGPNSLGKIPVVHIQNVSTPSRYAGLSDVEPMIPLQDELNTRLSDRAHRVTYQSFKMYLGKGIEDFLERPVGPGQMWSTQNLNSSIEEFGSDEGSPSEDIHIDQVRRAMDKVSGVCPLAAGLLDGKVGNLTSATALQVVLSGLLSRTNRKRLTYGAGLQNVAEMALEWLDVTGVFPTAPQDRKIDLHWPSPLPSDESEKLRNAQIKLGLGVPAELVLAELGYKRQEVGEQTNE